MRVALFVACLLALVAPVRAEVITVNGTLSGDAMPDGYKFEMATLAIRQEGVVIEVVGKSCGSFADERSCQRQTIVFAPPADSLAVTGNKAFYKQGGKQIWIGTVAGLGTVHWINLRKGAKLEATVTAARLKLDTAQLGGLSREDRFVLLHE